MLARLKAFGTFWYDFVVGDDWRIAAAVVVALTVTWALTSWLVMPIFLALLLPYSLWRAIRSG
jgi:uncharacterized membrane protein